MSLLEEEHTSVLNKYDSLKKRGGVSHSDLQTIDEMFDEFLEAYDDEEVEDEYLFHLLYEIESIVDDINIEPDDNNANL